MTTNSPPLPMFPWTWVYGLFSTHHVQKGVGVCVHQMNKYLSHAYIKENTLEAS